METTSPHGLPAAINAMTRPDFYPHRVEGPVRLAQTHCSYVLMTGPYAYKIKKAVRFGFLDFSTLAKRKRACEDELRLNRRFSSDLYLETTPIVRVAPGVYRLGGKGEIVEYALKMREFPQTALFSRLFEKGELTRERLRETGRLLARLHQIAPTDAEISGYGRVEAVRRVAEDNYRDSLPFVGDVQTAEQLEQTRAYTERFFDRHSDWFARRQREGRVRECHGDLHLNNIFLDGDRVQVFDCIEFNRSFRCIDVIYDAAFLAIDLEVRGRRDLAYAFLNEYLERTGDYFGAAMLPLYGSIRAYVKAKVASLTQGDARIGEEGRARARRQARACYRLAWDCARTHRAEIWAMSGLSGSGKSTVAAWLAERLGAVRIRSDAVRKHMGGAPLTESADPSLYTAEMTERVYRRMADLALLLTSQGLPVILDAKYDRRRFREEVTARARAKGVPARFLRCHAPLSELRKRLARRSGDVSDATPDLVWRQYCAEQPFSDEERGCLTTLDTTKPWRDTLSRFLEERAALCSV